MDLFPLKQYLSAVLEIVYSRYLPNEQCECEWDYSRFGSSCSHFGPGFWAFSNTFMCHGSSCATQVHVTRSPLGLVMPQTSKTLPWMLWKIVPTSRHKEKIIILYPGLKAKCCVGWACLHNPSPGQSQCCCSCHLVWSEGPVFGLDAFNWIFQSSFLSSTDFRIR